jgi:tol-pal system protein YbgF
MQPPPSQLDPQSLYNSGYNDYLRGDYDLALQSFRLFENFPGTELADNAAYWIGECYYRQGRYSQAINQFDNTISRYPGSDKLAAILLRRGDSLVKIGYRLNAAAQLEQLIGQFPTSDEAAIARKRLRGLEVRED